MSDTKPADDARKAAEDDAKEDLELEAEDAEKGRRGLQLDQEFR